MDPRKLIPPIVLTGESLSALSPVYVEGEREFHAMMRKAEQAITLRMAAAQLGEAFHDDQPRERRTVARFADAA